MKNNLFDTFIKEKLLQYKPDVPSHIWANIAAEKNKRKPLFFMGLTFGRVACILLLVTSVGAISYVLIQKNSSKLKPIIAKQQTPLLPKIVTSIIDTIILLEQPNTKNALNADVATNSNEINNANEYTATQKKIYTKAKANIKFKSAETTSPHDDDDDENLKTYYLPSVAIAANTLHSSYDFNPALLYTNIPKGLQIPTLYEDKKSSNKYVELYTSADYVFKTYEKGDANYIAKRKASTALNYAITLGMRYTKVFKNKISIKTGLHYSRVSEKFFGKNGYEVNSLASINANGDTIGNYLLTTPQYESKNNIYHSVDIPIQIGYEMGKGKWHTNIAAGGSINMFSKQKASVINTDGLAEDVSSGKSSSPYRYKNKAGLSLLASVGIHYKINRKTHVVVEPYLRYGLSPANLPSIDLKQKVHTTGVRFGVRKDL